MKILVDTSVWSLALRRSATSVDPQALKLKELILAGESIWLIGVILQEILQGLTTSEQSLKLRQQLSAFPLIELTRSDYEYAAELYSTCRQKGVQASTIDFLIAAAAIRYECLLLTNDKDFVRMAEILPLKFA